MGYYVRLLDQFPLRSIEDGFAEVDHQGWQTNVRRGRRTPSSPTSSSGPALAR
ncbi:MAG: hypothetical protein ABI130_08155 [Leifsonia sp.]